MFDFPTGSLVTVASSHGKLLFRILSSAENSCVFHKQFVLEIVPIDLFTVTAAILNLLESVSITGCPGGFAQYLRTFFGQKENFTVYFSGKRRSLLHPNTAQRSFFPITIFF